MQFNPKAFYYRLEKFIFLALLTGAFSLVVFLGVRHGGDIRDHYSAAIDATGQLGRLSQRLLIEAGRMPEAPAEEDYDRCRQNIRVLIRAMELKHASLLRGNPQMALRAPFSAEIQSEYLASSLQLDQLVASFLQQARFLLMVPRESMSAENSHLQYLQSAIQGSYIQAIGQLLQTYRHRYDGRINKIIIYIVGVLSLITILSLLAMLFWMRQHEDIDIPAQTVIPERAGNAVSLLRDGPHMPGERDLKSRLAASPVVRKTLPAN